MAEWRAIIQRLVDFDKSISVAGTPAGVVGDGNEALRPAMN